MGKIRRGGYIFITWIGDHGSHVHVYRDGALVTKWNLDDDTEEKGAALASSKVRELIHELLKEGRLGYEDKKSHRE